MMRPANSIAAEVADAQTRAPDRKDQRCEDQQSTPAKEVREAPAQERASSRSGKTGGNHHFDGILRKREIGRVKKLGAGNHSGVVSEKQAAQSGKRRGEVDEAAVLGMNRRRVLCGVLCAHRLKTPFDTRTLRIIGASTARCNL